MQVKTAAETFALISREAHRLIAPSLIAIYSRPGGSDIKATQIGTGFLIAANGRPTLVTARHVLFGHRNDEDPFTKHVVFHGRMRALFELESQEMYSSTYHDLAAVYFDEIGMDSCLQQGNLVVGGDCELLTVFGFLARDFRRSLKSGTLSPKPFLFTSRSIQQKNGQLEMIYARGRFKDTHSGLKVQAPRPEGLSGGLMLDAIGLLAGKVRVAGVFTEYVSDRGRALGESSESAMKLIDQMAYR
jgi:hypothetical protein